MVGCPLTLPGLKWAQARDIVLFFAPIDSTDESPKAEEDYVSISEHLEQGKSSQVNFRCNQMYFVVFIYI